MHTKYFPKHKMLCWFVSRKDSCVWSHFMMLSGYKQIEYPASFLNTLR